MTTVFSFDDNNCLKEDFVVDVVHKGQPFGLLPVILKIEKEGCLIKVSHQKFKYIKKAWSIDICREPVHIKKGAGAVDVLKKMKECQGKAGGPFCQEYATLRQALQDDGLIFAPGEKENLASDHGKVYCSYLLLKNYLEKSLVFNRGQDYSGALNVQYHQQVAEPRLEKESIEKENNEPLKAPIPEMMDEDEVENSAPLKVEQEQKEESPSRKQHNGQGFF